MIRLPREPDQWSDEDWQPDQATLAELRSLARKILELVAGNTGWQPDQATLARFDEEERQLIRELGFLHYLHVEELMVSTFAHLKCPDAPESLCEQKIFRMSLFDRAYGKPVEVAKREQLETNRTDTPSLSETTVLELVDRAYKHECTVGRINRPN